jgi:hypothetical protein
MNKNDFHKHIQIGAEQPILTAQDLEQLVDRYPFFQTAQLMLSKAYLQSGDYRQTDQIQQAALYAGDRSAVYHLLHLRPQKVNQVDLPSEAPSNDPVLTTAQTAAESDHDDLRDLAQRMLDEPAMASTTVKESANEPWNIVLTQVAAPKQEETIELPALEADVVPQLTDAPIVKDNLEPALNETILLEAIQRSIEQEILEDVRSQQTDSTPPLEPQQEDNNTLSPFARWMQQRSKEISFDADVVPMPQGKLPEDVQNWLRKPQTEGSETIEDRIEDLSPEDSLGLISHGAKRMDVPEKRDQQKALIDKFIQKEPRITPGKAADYSISDLAKESLEDDLGFVTETMAQLFVIQGKIDRAKKAFKKLMVLHPEKSVYFATQLKNIDRIKKL